MRKCGSAAVELVTPDKYKGFVKTVLQVISLYLFWSSFVMLPNQFRLHFFSLNIHNSF